MARKARDAARDRKGLLGRSGLPGLAFTRKMIEQGDLELMELSDDQW